MHYVPPLNGDATDPDRPYVDANPAAGIEGSVIPAGALEAPQREILAVITRFLGDGAPDADRLTQLAEAIDARIDARTLELGRLHLGLIVPDNCLELDGALLLRSDYPELWSWAETHGLIVPQADWSAGRWGLFGAGNGATDFRLPDFRGEFIRLLDGVRGVDAGRLLGQWQADDFKSHYHVMGLQGLGSAGGSTVVVSGSGSAVTTSAGGAETRPRNLPLRLSIAYA